MIPDLEDLLSPDAVGKTKDSGPGLGVIVRNQNRVHRDAIHHER